MPEWQIKTNSGELLQVGQHPRIRPNIRVPKGVGQHTRMVGQHKSERWVNMEQNLHLGGGMDMPGSLKYSDISCHKEGKEM
jgi:hypothetical protein